MMGTIVVFVELELPSAVTELAVMVGVQPDIVPVPIASVPSIKPLSSEGLSSSEPAPEPVICGLSTT